MKGNFETNPDEKSPDVGRARDDFKGQRTFEFELAGIDITELDYAAGSIGVDLGASFKITRLELQPNSPVHRVTNKKSISLYYSQDNTNFTRIADWKMTVKENGGIEITLNTSVTARYFKVKSMHDGRNFEFEATNQAEFINAPQDLIHIYYLLPSHQEEFMYDAIGNRTKETITQRSPVVRDYTYYPNSSRLKSNEKYTFEYDANGNLTKKETLIGEKVIWKYEYDLFNRLMKVKKNDSVVAEYMYDESGLRIKKTSPDSAIYYVFDAGGNVLYEQGNKEYMEYVYVLGKHFARIDGNLDNGILKKYFYHTDHLGSTVLVTDEIGEQVWSAEYTPFGKQVSKEGELDGAAKFTGKDLDEDTGLYYFNARWYDQETGRFISEDPGNDPNNPNLYVYVGNNPLTSTDPTGMWKVRDYGVNVSDEDNVEAPTLYYTVKSDPVRYYKDLTDTLKEIHLNIRSHDIYKVGPIVEKALRQKGYNGIGDKSGWSTQELLSWDINKIRLSETYHVNFSDILNMGIEEYKIQLMMAATFTYLTASERGNGVGRTSYKGQNQRQNGNTASTGGAGRAAQYSSNWRNASMQEVVNEIAPGSSPVVTDSGKIIYKNAQTGKQVVYDIEGNYFRIEDTTLQGKRVYTDINGKPIPNNKIVNGKQTGISQGEYNQTTHFNNTDSNFPYDMQ
jgi:RHS repeat-associated protein